MKCLFKNILASVLFISLAGCGNYKPPFSEPKDVIFGMNRVLVQGGDFIITTYQKVRDPSQPYVFYIEGDGLVWDFNAHRVSANPTPRSINFLKLASMDDRPNVVYVARPCQYTPMQLNPVCNQDYWTSKRFSEDSIASIDEVINKVNNGHKFSMIGFSGGGGAAILVAARNPMVKDIITIAANLDINAFTQYHKVAPMIGSMNPLDYAREVKDIPQLHLSGSSDKSVPPFIADNFTQRANSKCVRNMVIPSASHSKGWDKLWRKWFYKRPISCDY